MSDEQDEWFRTTSSWVWAAVAAAVAALVAIVDAVQGWHPVVTAGAVLFVVVAYAAFVRPRVGVRGGDVVLDHLYSTQTFPLAALEKVTVRRLLMLEAGGHTYTSGAIGRSSRELRREARGRVRRDDRTGAGQVTAKAPEYAEFVEARLSARARDARDRAGVVNRSPEQRALVDVAARSWDWPLIVVTVVVAVAFVVLLLV